MAIIGQHPRKGIAAADRAATLAPRQVQRVVELPNMLLESHYIPLGRRPHLFHAVVTV